MLNVDIGTTITSPLSDQAIGLEGIGGTGAILDGLVEALDEGIIIYDTQGRVRSATPRALGMLGTSWEELSAPAAFETQWQARDVNGRSLTVDDLPSNVTLRTGKNLRRQVIHLQHAGGPGSWLTISTSLLRDASRSVTGVMAVLFDVSDRFDLSHRMRESEALLAAVLSAAMVGIIATDEKQTVISFNAEAERMFGYEAREVIGGPLDLLIPTSARDSHRRQVDSFAAGGDTQRTMSNWRKVGGSHRDGHEFPLRSVISKVKVDGRLIFIAALQDMTLVQDQETRLQALLAERERQLAIVETASAAKSKFLSVMSHELRTPLNAIIGFSELMTKEVFGAIDNDQYRAYLSDILSSGKLLLGIINDILDISRIEAGKHELEMQPTDLGLIVADIASTYGRLAAGSGHKFQCDVTPGGVHASADPRAVQQIVDNLVSNALKFTPTGGSVSVAVEHEPADGQPMIRIRDSGIGIPADKLARLGEAFYQLSDSHARARGGTGLGLAIAKALAENMGGKLRLKSEMGQGTEVDVLLQPVQSESVVL